MTEKQQRLEMLYKEIDKICKENDIEYYLAGGSIIGVIRHRGFIPWDDDMDLLMTKKNFDKFVEVCKTQIPKDRVLECQELNHGYHNMFARYTDTTTCVIHANQLYFNDTAGYIVDILQLDPLPDAGKSYEKYLENMMLYSDLINCTVGYSFRWGMNQYKYKLYRLKMRIFGRNKVLNSLEKKLWCYDEDKCDYYAMRWGGIPFIFEKRMYEGKRFSDFYGVDAQLPFRSSDYLVWHYGDEWANIPPHNEQEGHVALYSLDVDYKAVRAEIDTLIDRKKSTKKMYRRKSALYSVMKNWRDMRYYRLLLKFKGLETDFNRYFCENQDKIQQAVKNNRFDELSSIFSEYFALQLHRSTIGREDFSGIDRFNNPFLMEIPKDIFEAAILTLMHTTRIASAIRLMDIYENIHGKEDKKLQDYRNAIMTYRRCVSELDLGDDTYAKNNIADLVVKYPYCNSFIRLAIRVFENNAPQEILKLLDKAQEMFPKDGEFQKIRADLTFDEDSTKAIKMYVDSYYNTPNGLVKLDIHDLLLSNADLVIKISNTMSVEEKIEWLKLIVEIAPEGEAFERELIMTWSHNVKISNDFQELYKFIREQSEYLKTNDIDISEFSKIIFDCGNEFIEDKDITKLIIESWSNTSCEEYSKTASDIKTLMKSVDTDDKKGWCLLIYSDCMLHLGNISEYITSVLEALKLYNSVQLKAMLGLTVRRELIRAFRDAQRVINFKHQNSNAEKKGLSEKKYLKVLYADRDRLANDYLVKIEKWFPNVESALNILEEFEVLSKKHAKKFRSKFDTNIWSVDTVIAMKNYAALTKDELTDFNSKEDEKELNTVNSEESMETNGDDEIIVTSKATKFEEVTINLLKELKQICDDNNIKFCLYGVTAAKAILEVPIDCAKVQVMMSVDNFVKLVRIMEQKRFSNRRFESMHNCKNYMNFSARYSDSTTTRIDLHETKSCIKTGAYVEIIPLRNEMDKDKKRKNIRLKEQGWECSFYMFRKLLRDPVFLAARIYTFFMTLLVSKRRYSKKLFEKLCEFYSGKITANCSVKEFSRTLIRFNENPVDNTAEIPFYGQLYSVPNNSVYFLKRVCGKNWKTKYANNIFNPYEIVSTNISADAFTKKYKNEFKRYYTIISEKVLTSAKVYKYNKYKSIDWKKAKICEKRAMLYYRYLPKMQQIRTLYKNKNYFRLNTLLMANKKAIDFSYNLGIGFAVNEELYKIQLELLRYYGNVKLADQLEKITPKEFMNPIG